MECDDGAIVGQHGFGTRNSRGDIFTAWLHGVGLCAANTMFRKLPIYLFTHCLTNGQQRQIDYVLCDKGAFCKCVDATTYREIQVDSDHTPVLAVFNLRKEATKNKRKNKTVRWRNTESQAYSERVLHALQNTSELTLERITSVMVHSAAEQRNSHTGHGKFGRAQGCRY